MSEESVVLTADAVFKWDGPKRKQTVFKAKLGRLVLTDRRLVFLSTGSNDLSAMKFLAGARGTDAVLNVSQTGSLDISALTNEGALDVPATQLRGAELHGMFKVLTVRWVDGAGVEHAATFAEKNGGMPGGPAWVELLDRVAAQASAAPRSQPDVAEGWFADPHGRHELRYWDGTRWTEHVSDRGQLGTDPAS